MKSHQKYINIIIFLGIVILTVSYTYYLRPITDDELFNYGFSKSILEGLIPYRDFNMIIPPLFHYLLVIPLFIFGKKLIVYHIVIAIMIADITYLSYKKLGLISIVIYLLLLVYPYTGYNMFCLFLLFILINLKENKYYTILEAVIISVMFLSKQTLGLLVIPSLIFSKDRKKTLLIYIVSLLAFFLYLILNSNLVEFIDYCILGMFDFTSKNNTGTNGFIYVEIIILIGLFYFSFKYKKRELFYVLCFQIMTFPIVDYYHFVISFIPVVYLILNKLKDNKIVVLYFFALVITFFALLNYDTFISDDSYLFLSNYKVDNFMKGRMCFNITSSYVFQINDFLEKYDDYRPYLLGTFSYLVKLNNDIPINKYDIINNGNLGYGGSEKYISEIEEYCSNNKCIFVIRDEEITTKKYIQVNRDILKYVSNNYHKIYISNVFSVYITDDYEN